MHGGSQESKENVEGIIKRVNGNNKEDVIKIHLKCYLKPLGHSHLDCSFCWMGSFHSLYLKNNRVDLGKVQRRATKVIWFGSNQVSVCFLSVISYWETDHPIEITWTDGPLVRQSYLCLVFFKSQLYIHILCCFIF